MRVYLGLGSNLGNRGANLQAGLRLLAPLAPCVAVASIYESAPVGPAGQAPYWNTAAVVETEHDPLTLLGAIKRIEWAMGRRPGVVWGPRPLDMDILLTDDPTIDLPTLQIPHPRLAERGFVLVPLAEIAGESVVPTLGQTVAQLRARVAEEDVPRRLGAFLE